VLVPEIPGIRPEVLALADHLVEEGFTVVIPSLFGEPGRAVSFGYSARVISHLCVSTEFRAFAVNAQRPITAFLRAVAADLAGRTPAAGVGVIGMCFTGGFALATGVDDSVLASVLSQPAVSFPLGARRRADPGMSESELERVAQRAADSNLCALGLASVRTCLRRASGSPRFESVLATLSRSSNSTHPRGIRAVSPGARTPC
jgi:Dienelactone hydrolase family